MNVSDGRLTRGPEIYPKNSSFAGLIAGLIGLVVVLAAFWMWSQPASLALVIAPIMTVIIALWVPNARLVAVVAFLNYPYAQGAYIAAQNGITFFPRPPLSSYEFVAHEQTLTLFFALGISLLSGVAQAFQRAAASGWQNFQSFGLEGVASMGKNLALVFAVAIIVGLHDATFLVANLGAVLSSGRHTFRDEFWVGNGPFGIVLALVIGLILLLTAIGIQRYRVQAAIALAIFWMPSLVAGSRNYFSVLMLGALCAALFAIKSRSNRSLVLLGAATGIAAFAWLPTLWSSNDLVGFNEWILPTSSYLPLALGLFTVEGLGATPMAHQWALLLPGPLRPFSVHLYAEAFADSKFTNVGVAGNPWSDAYDPHLMSRVLVFALAFVGIFLLASILRRVHAVIPFLAFGLMAFWGRSVFWNTAVILVYAAVMLRLFVPLKLNGDSKS
ncbi:hypothetical protein ACIQF8_17035 [Pseudarthrobacter sp. NPDC092184]|uniref:hypothetical protein n=1 Tax=unclassified Pseudarthrobacter TaxID=2647000 RepID=UPI00381FC2B9